MTVVTQQPVVTQVAFNELPVTYTGSDGKQVSHAQTIVSTIVTKRAQ